MLRLSASAVLALVVLSGCPGPATGSGGTLGGRGDVDSEEAASRCGGLAPRDPVASSGDPRDERHAENDLYQAYLDSGGIARLQRVWLLGGVGGVHALLEGTMKRNDVTCAVSAAVLDRDGARVVVPMTSELDRGRLVFAGVFDLAGCPRSMAVRAQELAFDSHTITQLAHMRQPAVAFWAGNDLRFYHLGAGRFTLAAQLRPNHEGNTGRYQAINSIEIIPGDDGALARWDDVFHPNDPGEHPTSPVAQRQEAPIAVPDHSQTRDALPDASTATRDRLAAAVEADAIGAIHVAEAQLPHHDGWLFTRVTRAGSEHLAVGRFVALHCGGLAVDEMIALGPATSVRWILPIRLDEPSSFVPGEGRHLPLLALEDALTQDALPEDALPGVERLARRRDAPGGPARHLGLAVITHGVDDEPSLHLVRHGHGLLWQHPAPLPDRVEIVQGVAEMPHILAGGRIYRFEGDRYQREERQRDGPGAAVPEKTGSQP